LQKFNYLGSNKDGNKHKENTNCPDCKNCSLMSHPMPRIMGVQILKQNKQTNKQQKKTETLL
jgi:hypothetical protein